MSDIGIEKSGHVALVEIRRPPNNFFDIPLIREIADAFETFDEDVYIRAVVLAAQGKAFCAGANFGDGSTLDAHGRRPNEPVQGSRHFMLRATDCFVPESQLLRQYMGRPSVVASVLQWWPTSA
jgi:enoyl-CoA hydratase/carnithine racemase